MENNLREEQLTTLRRLRELRDELASLVAANAVIELKIIQEPKPEKPQEDYYLQQAQEQKKFATYRVRDELSTGWTVFLCIASCILLAVLYAKVLLVAVPDIMERFPFSVLGVSLGVPIILAIKFATRKAHRKAVAEVEKQYEPIISEAIKKDLQAQADYEEKLKEIENSARERYQAEIDANIEKMRPIVSEQKQISILAKEDEKHLDKIIQLMESGRADSLKEALNLIDAAAASAPAPAPSNPVNVPGTVRVSTTEDGRSKDADVYVDGNYFGAISLSTGTTTFKLQPGLHNISVVIYCRGNAFQSGVQSFELKSGGNVCLDFDLIGYGNIICRQR